MLTIGIDGGGTRTRAVALAEDGSFAGWAAAGAGNFQVIGLAGLDMLLQELMAGLQFRPGQDAAMCVALAGAGRRGEQRQIVQLARDRGWAQRVSAVSDARAALEGAHGGAPGLIVIAGTGSIVLGKDAADREVRAGGWGPLLGDEGSGYVLGLEGLRAVFRARDGWGDSTGLDAALKAALELDDWDQLVAPLYAGELGRDRIAALAPVVLALADSVDPAAAAIVSHQAHCLGRKVAAVAHRLDLQHHAPLACAGGVFRAGAALWQELARAATADGVRVSRCEAMLAPALGAALLARKHAGQPLAQAMVSHLAGAAPEMP
jgi:N-acetylmuramic acid 6-phosphate etherase